MLACAHLETGLGGASFAGLMNPMAARTRRPGTGESGNGPAPKPNSADIFPGPRPVPRPLKRQSIWESTATRKDRFDLARDDLIQATGSVDKILGGGRYLITLESGQTVTAQLSGRMRRFRIRVIPGDRVQVGLSPYDPTHGFITFRLREGESRNR